MENQLLLDENSYKNDKNKILEKLYELIFVDLEHKEWVYENHIAAFIKKQFELLDEKGILFPIDYDITTKLPIDYIFFDFNIPLSYFDFLKNIGENVFLTNRSIKPYCITNRQVVDFKKEILFYFYKKGVRLFYQSPSSYNELCNIIGNIHKPFLEEIYKWLIEENSVNFRMTKDVIVDDFLFEINKLLEGIQNKSNKITFKRFKYLDIRKYEIIEDDSNQLPFDFNNDEMEEKEKNTIQEDYSLKKEYLMKKFHSRKDMVFYMLTQSKDQIAKEKVFRDVDDLCDFVFFYWLNDMFHLKELFYLVLHFVAEKPKLKKTKNFNVLNEKMYMASDGELNLNENIN